jgi:hypothetical protein
LIEITVAYLLIARTMEPEKQPLLVKKTLKQRSFVGNGHETNNRTTSVARQQIIDKRQLNGNRTAKEERCFLCGPFRYGITETVICKSAQLKVSL